MEKIIYLLFGLVLAYGIFKNIVTLIKWVWNISFIVFAIPAALVIWYLYLYGISLLMK